MSNQRGAPPKVQRLTVTIDSDDMRIIFDKPAQRLRIMKLDGGGLPIGRIEEHTFADALNILHEFSGPLAQPTPEDTKRLDHLEAWLDGFEWVHLPTQIEPEVRCDWFAGDGSGHWFTQGKTFREAIDKSLNHEATQESHD